MEAEAVCNVKPGAFRLEHKQPVGVGAETLEHKPVYAAKRRKPELIPVRDEKAEVSVIIPCYNCLNTVERAVLSVVGQTLPPKEIILVDDKSSDGGLAKLQELERRYAQVRVVALERNSGAATARNRGWAVATQPYVALLDADDSWHERKLELQYAWMKAHPEVALSATPFTPAQTGQRAHAPTAPSARRVPKWELLLSNRFTTSTVMLKTSVPFRFMPAKRYSEDYLLWLQLAFAGAETWLLNAPLTLRYKASYGEGGLSAQMWNMQKGQLHTYRQLQRDRAIHPFSLCLLLVYSFAKYLRRLAVVSFR